MPRALALPVVEDAGRIRALLRSLAPIAGRQGAVLLPGPAVHVQVTVAVPRDAQEAHRRRFVVAAHGERELPPQPLHLSATTLGLDRLAKLLVDLAHDGRCGVGVVPDRGQTEQVGGELGTVRVEDEGPADAERTPDQTRFENDVVAR